MGNLQGKQPAVFGNGRQRDKARHSGKSQDGQGQRSVQLDNGGIKMLRLRLQNVLRRCKARLPV